MGKLQMEAHNREVRLNYLARELLLQGGGNTQAWDSVLRARRQVREEIRDLASVAKSYESLT